MIENNIELIGFPSTNLHAIEKYVITLVMAKSRTLEAAGKKLGISRHALKRRLVRHGLQHMISEQNERRSPRAPDVPLHDAGAITPI